MKRGIIVIVAILSFLIVVTKSNAEMKITPGGVTFPDNTTQTTSATGGSGQWSANGFKIYYNSGNVGIGTTDPGEKLEVGGNIKVSGDGNGIKFPDGTVQTTASAPTWHQILPAADRFKLVLNSNAAVLDKETGLVWEKSPSTSTFIWRFAQLQCHTLTLGNRKGWRLPTIQELGSLVDPTQSNPALPAGHPFTALQLNGFYWSASTVADIADTALAMELVVGNIAGSAMSTSQGFAWCVRGGLGVGSQ
jgi:hypothetical protein